MSEKSVPSGIVDFHPSTFQAKADAEFFYSMGEELKHSDEITSQAPTLLGGRTEDELVSPDTKKIAVVTNGALFVVSADGRQGMGNSKARVSFRLC